MLLEGIQAVLFVIAVAGAGPRLYFRGGSATNRLASRGRFPLAFVAAGRCLSF